MYIVLKKKYEIHTISGWGRSAAHRPCSLKFFVRCTFETLKGNFLKVSVKTILRLGGVVVTRFGGSLTVSNGHPQGKYEVALLLKSSLRALILYFDIKVKNLPCKRSFEKYYFVKQSYLHTKVFVFIFNFILMDFQNFYLSFTYILLKLYLIFSCVCV